MTHEPRPLPGRSARAFPSLFGHVDVPFLRHAAGLVGATFAASGLASIVINAFWGVSLAAAGRLPSHWSAGTLFTLLGLSGS